MQVELLDGDMCTSVLEPAASLEMLSRWEPRAGRGLLPGGLRCRHLTWPEMLWMCCCSDAVLLVGVMRTVGCSRFLSSICVTPCLLDLGMPHRDGGCSLARAPVVPWLQFVDQQDGMIWEVDVC